MTDGLIGVGLTLLVPAAPFLGVVVGIVVCVFLKREELRIAQRGVDEARQMLLDAGLWPPDPAGSEPLPATPAHAEGRYTE